MRRAISTITIFLFVNCLATAASSETLKLVIKQHLMLVISMLQYIRAHTPLMKKTP